MSAPPCIHFSLAEIQFATNDFDEELVIGHGGFGKVYRGQICSEEGDQLVAIKRMDLTSNQGEPEFKAEIQVLSQLCHHHLVSLIGFCDDNKEMILVYKYMPHGTLYHHLHKAKTPLSWVQRLKIAVGAGNGLNYLHSGVGTQQEIIHRDVKSLNILLDENWEAMISDFGLSKIRPTNQSLSYLYASIKGTFGYLDPEYFYTKKLTTKTDVYAFGVVLFELLSGRLAVDERNSEDNCSLVRWAQKCIKNRKLDQMVDNYIKGTITTKCLKGYVKIADRCICSVPKERPSMTEVVASLQALLELQEKADIFAMLPSRMGFTSKMLKHLVSASKLNSDQSGKSSRKSLEDMNRCTLINKDGSYHGEMLQQSTELIVARDIKVFTYGELKHATRNFSRYRELGFGFNGNVYRGWLNNTADSTCNDNTSSPVAVRRFGRYKLFDLEIFKEFHHPNLVQLIGYCINDRDLFLVYDFMCNGNFKDLLYTGAVAQLPLVTKLKIVVGVARGIVFLKEAQLRFKKMRKMHIGSLIARNKILFDEDFTVKISRYEFPVLVHGFDTHKTGMQLQRLSPVVLLELMQLPNLNKDYHADAFTVPSNPYSFTKLFKEVVTGNRYHSMSRSAKRSLGCIAKLCFHICNEVEAESKMLTIMQMYKKHFPEWGIHDSHLVTSFNGIKHNDLRKQDMEKDKQISRQNKQISCQNKQISCLVVTIIFVGVILIWLVCKMVLLLVSLFS